MVKKKLLALLALLMGLLALVPLFSNDTKSLAVTGYSIANYSFDVTGKTKESALRRDVVPAVEPVYDSETDLVGALDAKRQVLLNRRLFNAVSYSYTLTAIADSIAYYDVLFTVEDASSIFALPYPKYSTDDGLRFGIKGYNRNLLGTYSQLQFVINTTQTSARDENNFWDWSQREDYFLIELDNFLVGSASIDIDTEFSGRLFSYGSYDVDINVKDIPFFGAKLRFNPSIEGTVDPTGLWTITQYELITDLGTFRIGDARHSWYNEVTLTGQVPTAIATTTTIRQHDLSVFSHPINFSLTVDAAAKLRNAQDDPDFIPTLVKLGPDLGTGFSLPLGFSWYTNVAPRLNIPQHSYPEYWVNITYSNTLSRSNINWHDDFRTGSSLKLRFNMYWDMMPEPVDNPADALDPTKTGWIAEAQFTWFPFATKLFNPSLRLTGHYSNAAKGLLPLDDADTGETTVIADYMRGILESNFSASALGDSRMLALIGNFNLTTRFINLGSFAKTYVSPFVDFGIFSDSDTFSTKIEDYDWLGTVGFEGIGILNWFPSFPIRASLGLNLKDIISYSQKQIAATDIEYEIFFGMDFFF